MHYGRYLFCLSKDDGAVVWKERIPDCASGMPTIDVFKGKVYVSVGGYVFAYFARTGKMFWTEKFSKDSYCTTCMIHNRSRDPLLYISYRGKIFCFDTAARSLIMKVRVAKPNYLISMIFKKGRLYAAYTKKLLCFDDGMSLLWERNLAGHGRSVSLYIDRLDETELIFALCMYNTLKINISSFHINGKKRWVDYKFTTMHACPGSACMVIQKGIVCAGSSSGTMVTLDPVNKYGGGKIRGGLYWLCFATTTKNVNTNSQPLLQETYMATLNRKGHFK